jgi:uncharacterized membrane protein HdeD (DUF308 family)
MSTLQSDPVVQNTPAAATRTNNSHSPWMWFLIPGVALIAMGMVAMALPLATALAVEMFLGVLLLLAGIGYAVHAFKVKGWEGIAWSIAWAVLYCSTGVMLLAYPLSGVVTLAFVLSVLFVLEGISKLLLAARLSAPFNRLWLVLDGVIGAGLGVLIWSQWPSDSAWVIGILVGIRFLMAGTMLLSFAFVLKNHNRNSTFAP